MTAITIYPLLTLRYEHALPLVGDRRISTSLVVLCLLLAACIAATMWIAASAEIGNDWLAQSAPSELWNQFPLIVLAAAALALGSISQLATLAAGSISRLAISRIARAVSMVILQLAFVFALGASATSVLMGEILATLVGVACLVSAVGFSAVLDGSRWIRLGRRLPVLAYKFREFPLITLPHILSHSALALAFAMLFGGMYGAAALGQYFLMRKLLFGALGLFSVAIYQHSVADAARVPKTRLFGIAVQAIALMGGVSVVMAGILLLAGPQLFEIMVGSQWAAAGVMATAAATLIVMEPITSTLAFLPVFLGHQRAAFAVAVAQGSVGLLALGIAGWLGLTAAGAIVLSSLAMSGIMLAYVSWLLRRAHAAAGGQLA